MMSINPIFKDRDTVDEEKVRRNNTAVR